MVEGATGTLVAVSPGNEVTVTVVEVDETEVVVVGEDVAGIGVLVEVVESGTVVAVVVVVVVVPGTVEIVEPGTVVAVVGDEIRGVVEVVTPGTVVAVVVVVVPGTVCEGLFTGVDVVVDPGGTVDAVGATVEGGATLTGGRSDATSSVWSGTCPPGSGSVVTAVGGSLVVGAEFCGTTGGGVTALHSPPSNQSGSSARVGSYPAGS